MQIKVQLWKKNFNQWQANQIEVKGRKQEAKRNQLQTELEILNSQDSMPNYNRVRTNENPPSGSQVTYSDSRINQYFAPQNQLQGQNQAQNQNQNNNVQTNNQNAPQSQQGNRNNMDLEKK